MIGFCIQHPITDPRRLTTPYLPQARPLSRSPQSEGMWRLVYTSTKGSSSGKLGPFVGEVLQEIDTRQTRCEWVWFSHQHLRMERGLGLLYPACVCDRPAPCAHASGQQGS
jgi:hypothetical protein